MIDLKTLIPKELRNKHGVYSIHNKITNKYYFGSTSEKRGFISRLSNHLIELRNNKHKNTYLQRAWNKYGEKNFEFKIRLICSPSLALKLEQIYIDKCLKINNSISSKLGYNINPNATSSLGSKRTEEQIFQNRIRQNGKHIVAIDNNLNIIKETISIREMARELNLERRLINKVIKNQVRTHNGLAFCLKENLHLKLEEIKNNNRYFNENKGIINTWSTKSVKITNLLTREIIIVDSLKSAAIYSNMKPNNIWRNLNNKRKSKKYKFEYL